MKSLKKAGIFLIISVVLTVLLPATALAGVTGGSVVFSELTNLTSSNPWDGYAWTDSAPTAPYTATLTASSGYVLPSGITVQKISYDESAEVPYPIYVSRTLKQYVDYTYDNLTGEIVIPVTTLQEIAYNGSPYDIRIIASGALDEPWYGSNAVTVFSDLTDLASTNPLQPYLTVPSVPYTATLSANPGYSLPASITVQRISFDTTGGVPPYPEIVAETYVLNTGYTYNAATGVIVIPIAALDDIIYEDSPYHIRIIASGVANPSAYTITVTQSSHGTISPAVANNITPGSNFTFTLAPDTGHHIADVLVDGESIGAVNSYTFTNIQSNHTITALFEETSETPPPSEMPPPSDDPLDDIPKAGDSSLSWIWWLLLGVSVPGIATLIVIRKKPL